MNIYINIHYTYEIYKDNIKNLGCYINKEMNILYICTDVKYLKGIY